MVRDFDTYAFRFALDGAPDSRRIVYLLRKDFVTPQDCFYEDDEEHVPHWHQDTARAMTWGRMAGPLDLVLGPTDYARYAALADACQNRFMSLVIRDSVARMLQTPSV